MKVVDGVVLDSNTAIHLESISTHVDQLSQRRPIGSQWLVTRDDAETWIEDVSQRIIKVQSGDA